MIARENLNNPIVIRTYTVASGKTVDKGYPVKRSGADTDVEKIAAIGDNGFGIALDAGTAGQTVRVLEANGIVKALVGTGGASMGAFAKYAANGLTDATIGGGTDKLVVYGQFLETKNAGELCGMRFQITPTVGS